MTPAQIYELIGYLASVLVLISLLMTSIVKLRIINAIGALLFTIYALIIASYPTALMNGILVFVDLYYLRKVLRTKTHFSYLVCTEKEQAVQHFLKFYKDDIYHFFPHFKPDQLEDHLCFMVYSDSAPVGMMVGTRGPNGAFAVDIDYSTPAYRDCSVAKYLYSQLPSEGIHKLSTAVGQEVHNRYLRTMGFHLEKDRYHLDLKN